LAENNQSNDNFITAAAEINVNEIMAAIKNKIEDKKASGVLKQFEIDDIADMELFPLPDFLEIPNVYEPHLYRIKVDEQYQPIHIPHEIEDGQGIRGLIKSGLKKTRSLFLPLIRFMIRPFTNELRDLIVNLHNQNKQMTAKIPPMEPIVLQSKEYIIHLHNCLNNMIVELTKLKIEEEMLKTKLKILEDKIDFIEKRERAIEKKLF
jgi:hypothetical protein